ncbi:hypothetical protein [Mucilaginibacter sp.]|uniref:hypothetical protein n=1 Tax=Mucilaginibacter sp. TaxID=1882438 RepID=UPI002847C1C2|nr:hypothetical protein [Mucilaginibacter sp.]MDR3695771.1 hypothetical protein [Mucilaginibacter sp.]
MEWYNYVACFFAGAFLANAVPHYIKGVCGDKFPTPFAKPPGKGLSSPPINVLWGLLNLVIGFVLLRAGKVRQDPDNTWPLIFGGIALMSVLASKNFQKKDKE